jgi:PRTRC genetic system protein A
LSQETKTTGGIGGAGDLFDAMGAEGEQFKPKKEEKKQSPKPASGNTTAARPKVYPEGTLVVHQGDHKTLDKEMTEKEVYDLFNEDHPDVSMDRYELLEDKEKRRFWFRAKGFKKGGRPERNGRPFSVLTAVPEWLETFPPVSRVLAWDGVYEIRRTHLGCFASYVPSDLDIREGFYPEVPKAPVSLLVTAISAFRDRPKHEAVLEIFYDKRDGSFRLYWPPQRNATAGSVEYDPLPETDDVLRYLSVHSHNAMPAFFSSTDDEFETATGLFGVIGRVEDDRPEALFRASCGGLFVPLQIEDLFDDADLARSLVTDPLARRGPVRGAIREALHKVVRP